MPISEASEWDEFVAGHGHGHHEQSSGYGAQRASMGFSCDRVVVRCGGEIVGGAQVLSRMTPLGRLGHVQRGPLACRDDAGVMRQVVAELEGLAGRLGLAGMRVDTFEPQCASREALCEAGFGLSDAWCEKLVSRQVRLVGDGDALVSSMRRKTRYAVRAALREGVCVRVGGEAEVGEFHRLHRMTAEHQGFPVFPVQYFEYLWDMFGSRGGVQHFIAYHDGQPIGAICNTVVGNRMYYGWGGIDRERVSSKVQPNFPLHVEAMNWARERGCEYYDFAGDTLFKRKFTDEAVRWPSALRKFYGSLSGVRASLLAWSWSARRARRWGMKVAGKLGMRQKMPH